MGPVGRGPGVASLLIDGEPAGSIETDAVFFVLISWSGLDVGLDRGTTVTDYAGDGRFLGPFPFTGTLTTVTVDLIEDQALDHAAAGAAEIARQ